MRRDVVLAESGPTIDDLYAPGRPERATTPTHPRTRGESALLAPGHIDHHPLGLAFDGLLPRFPLAVRALGPSSPRVVAQVAARAATQLSANTLGQLLMPAVAPIAQTVRALDRLLPHPPHRPYWRPR